MDLVLCYFLISCHIVLVVGSLISLSNPRKCYRNDNDSSNIIYSSEESSGNSEESYDVSHECHPESSSNGKDSDKTTSTLETTPVNGSNLTVRIPDYHVKRDCPEGQSAITENDLISMIQYFKNEINLVDSINETYFNIAVSVRDKNIQNINDYLTLLNNKPRHLKHLLEGLTQKREKDIEPVVKEIASKLPEISSLNYQYNKKIKESGVYFKKLEKAKQICALNCDTTEFRSVRNKRAFFLENEEVIYCDTLKRVKNKIMNDLTEFKDKYIQDLRNNTVKINDTFVIKIQGLKTQLKEAAVKLFGITLYDVLSLMDEYDHYLHLIKDNSTIYNIKNQLKEIKKTHLEIDLKLDDFKSSVEIYRKKCLNCGIQRRSLMRFQRDVTQKGLISPSESANVLDRLLHTAISQIENIFKEDQDNIFEYLNVIFNDTETMIVEKLRKLQPIQHEIKEYIAREQQAFEKLKNQAPEALLQNLKKLNVDSKDLLNKIIKMQKFIDDNV